MNSQIQYVNRLSNGCKNAEVIFNFCEIEITDKAGVFFCNEIIVLCVNASVCDLYSCGF